MSKLINLVGKKFGKLTVLEFSHSSSRGIFWKCVCDCGKTKILFGDSLKSGDTKSCGCVGRGKKPYPETLFNRIYSIYISSAKSRGYEFSLSKERAKYLMSLNCFYCGCFPSNCYTYKGQPGNFIYNGIDRVDNHKGYTDDNCVPCCEKCNRAKGTMSYKEFKDWLFSLADYMTSKKILYAR